MNDNSFEDSSERINKLYQNGSFQEVITLVKKFGSDVTEYCMKMDGVKLQRSFYKSFIYIIEDINQKILGTHCNIISQDMVLIKHCLICARNSFYKSTFNQKLVGEDDELLNPLIDILKTLIKCLQFNKTAESICSIEPQKEGKTCLKDKELESLVCSTTSVCITMFVNMMAGNSAVRSRLWPTLHSLILKILSLPESELNHFGAALLHQFLLEEELKRNFHRNNMAVLFIPALLKAYMESGPNACFSLYCLQILIEFEESVSSSWASLSAKESLLILDVLTTFLQKGRYIPLNTVHFFTDLFKKEADKIFRTFSTEGKKLDPIVTIRITTFLCCAASADRFTSSLQEDKSLLISSVYLLKGITDIGDTSNNFFTRVNDMDASVDFENHPAFGFKSDLIRLIAALVYRNKENQDRVRDIDGILLILENSQYDARNPLIREASIFALRNLLEDNRKNQRIISDLQLRGTAENESLNRLGLAVSIENGKVELHQN